jgi:superfamily II RNA helicase
MSFTIIHPTNEPFTKSNPTEYFPFKYQLDNFQLHGCKAIDDNENVLITAHTGSGKTALALYAISRCLAQGKKVIYTSPIKTLSNQKFKEFSESFPDVGILTGDVKINPTAKCLILTAEILRNSLLQKRDEEVYDWNFNPDDVACVILDEVHFINNKERGKVWEEIIINLSPNIQLVMLSATISGANEMVDWIGNLKKVNCHLISTAKRPVPLTHSIYWDDELYKYEENETWIHDSWKNIKKDIDKYYSKNRHTSHTFHKCLEYLRNKDLLPATVFLLNRDAVEKQAKSLTVFVEDHMANAEIKRIWDKNLLKYRDIYQHTEQWNTVFDLVCKGVGIHHSGMIPVLKEIVEILYNQGLIKVLLATETFALGVNSPTKTVIFTNLTKFDGTQRRLLRPEEYGQMAGRAGRRGLDTFGNVIILPFPDFITESEAKEIIKAPPQKISSKLSLDYSIILKLLNYKLERKDSTDPIEYIFNILSKTLFNGQEEKINSGILRERKQLVDKMELFMSTVGKSIEEKKDKFIELVEIKNKLKPNGFIRLDKKVEKKLLQQKSSIENDIPSSIMKTMEQWYELDHTLKQINREVEFNENKLKYHIEDMLSYLLKNEMIDESAQLTIKGRVVSEVNECNPLILGKIINSNILDDLEFNQIISLLSIFVADRSGSDDIYISDLDASEQEKDALKMIHQWKEELEKEEASLMNNIPFTFSSEWSTSLSMYEATKHWCNGNIWLEMKDTFNNFEGNFIKNIIRLGNLTRNILSIAKILNNVKLINKLDGYQEKLIRDIVITDSLYI